MTEFGVAYYQSWDPSHFVKDVEELTNNGFNSILLGVSEYDYWFWHDSVRECVRIAGERGLKTYVNLWGWGKIFGGEPPSLYLQHSIKDRQVSNKGEILPAVCPNSPRFREYILNRVEDITREWKPDYVFLDEPHYLTFLQEPMEYKFKEFKGWSCRREICKEKFREKYGFEMPEKLTSEVLEFREETLFEFLRRIAQKVVGHGVKVDVCILPTIGEGVLVGKIVKKMAEKIGISDWRRIFKLKEVDTFSTDPYWILIEKGIFTKLFFKGYEWYKDVAQSFLSECRRENKRSQIWIQIFKVPREKWKEALDGIEYSRELGYDSIFFWAYNSGAGSILKGDDSEKFWRKICEYVRTCYKGE